MGKDDGSGSGRSLLPQHQELLRKSAIADAVAEARGYFSATKRTELGDLGFARYQQLVPALVVPIWGVRGEVVNYQSRPDRPRVDAERGREVKYETVADSSVRLDVPPGCRPLLGSPLAALWVTEGSRKADALASAGVCAISVLGVDCINTDDWDRVALDERRVYVVFDSDVMVKRTVHGALERLAKLLRAKGAAVSFVYLPTTEGKIGVDDYLAGGGTVEDLYALAEDELREPPPEEKPKQQAALPTAYLLNVIERLVRRFVHFPSEHEPVALALFVAHTYALAAAQATPYMLVVSPEKRSGKTRALEVAELIVHAPVRAANITAAGVFQAIEQWQPTMLVDELDAVFRSRSEQAEALRAVLNAGNRRGSHVIRGSQDGKPQRFGTYCPKMLAGINNGKLPDTIRDRSIVIAMQRKRVGETVEDLFPTELADQLAELRRRLDDWAAENVDHLAGWRRSGRVAGLDDRLQEAWDPLLAIAALANPEWAEKAQSAATALANGAEDASDAAHGHLLIEALRGIFGDSPALFSKDICRALNADDELPFGGYNQGAGIQPRDLAKLLKPYGIKPCNVRVGTEQAKGYERDQFDEVWQRYARSEDPPEEASQASQRPNEPESSTPAGDSAGTDGNERSVPDPSQPESQPPRADRPLWDVGTDGTHAGTDARDARVSANGADTNGPLRTVADLTDEELLAIFTGSTLGPESEAAPCGCGRRTREWRKRGPAFDVACTYLSGKEYAGARAAGNGNVIPKGPRSGWVYGETQLDRGHPWQCELCHPPAPGLDVEWRTVEGAPA
jgi:hypothetical protein